jgi:hypothetical protein
VKPLLVVLALVAGAFLAGPALAQTLYIKNSSAMPTAQLVDEVSAWQTAVDQDFAPEWGVRADLVVTDVVPPNAPWVELLDQPDCFYCAGYHDVLDRVPHAEIGVSGDTAYDSNTATHEIFEVLADPYINRGMLISPRRGVRRRWYALEVADPVEADRLSYTRVSATGQPVAISDFVREAWFRRGSHGPWDFTSATKHALQVLKDGYQLLWTGWEWATLPRP